MNWRAVSISLACLAALPACRFAQDAVASRDASADAHDSGADAHVTCEQYSCKPGCTCDVGLVCGRLAPYVCSTPQCASDLTHFITCLGDEVTVSCTGTSNVDIVPGCTFNRVTNAGTAAEERWYCCP